MSVYVISRVVITDPVAMQEYIDAAAATVSAYGGRYLVRGDAVEALEGTWDHDRMVVLEFADRDTALAWYESPAYRPLRDLRQSAADTVILLAEGVPELPNLH